MEISYPSRSTTAEGYKKRAYFYARFLCCVLVRYFLVDHSAAKALRISDDANEPQ